MFGRKNVVRGRQEPHILFRNVQTGFLEYLAGGTCFGRFAKVEVTARELECACVRACTSIQTPCRAEDPPSHLHHANLSGSR